MSMWQKFKRGVARMMNMNVLPEASMNDESFLEWVGVHKNGTKNPTADVTYFTCLKMMSETIAKMPWKLYQKTANGIKEQDNEVAVLMKRRPNPFMTPTTFWNAVEMNRNHFGNAYVYVRSRFKRQKYGGELKVLDMWIMPSDCVQIIVDDKGYFGGAGKIWYSYIDKYSGKQYIFSTDEVLHFKTSHSLDGITGLPVQYILKSTVDGVIESQNFLNNLYKNGLTAKATLEYTGDLNEEAKNKLVAAFEQYGAGSKNTGKILPVPLGMKLTPLDIKLTDSQFIELKKYSALQIAAAFGIKPNQINDYEKSSYSNSEMQQLSFYVDTMLFVLKQYEEEVNWKLLSEDEQENGFYWKMNEKVLLRTDSKTQMEILKTGVEAGIETRNEARRKLDLMDAEGGDILIVNGAYVPLVNVGAAYEGGKMGEGDDPDDTQPDNNGGKDQGDQTEQQSDGTDNPIQPAEQSEDGEEGGKNEDQNDQQEDDDQGDNDRTDDQGDDQEDSDQDDQESQEQETAETDEPDEDQEGGEEDDEDDEDELHKKKQSKKAD